MSIAPDLPSGWVSLAHAKSGQCEEWSEFHVLRGPDGYLYTFNESGDCEVDFTDLFCPSDCWLADSWTQAVSRAIGWAYNDSLDGQRAAGMRLAEWLAENRPAADVTMPPAVIPGLPIARPVQPNTDQENDMSASQTRYTLTAAGETRTAAADEFLEVAFCMGIETGSMPDITLSGARKATHALCELDQVLRLGGVFSTERRDLVKELTGVTVSPAVLAYVPTFEPITTMTTVEDVTKMLENRRPGTIVMDRSDNLWEKLHGQDLWRSIDGSGLASKNSSGVADYVPVTIVHDPSWPNPAN